MRVVYPGSKELEKIMKYDDIIKKSDQELEMILLTDGFGKDVKKSALEEIKRRYFQKEFDVEVKGILV
jgi:hypothetical protein